jgi:hypothetical protein
MRVGSCSGCTSVGELDAKAHTSELEAWQKPFLHEDKNADAKIIKNNIS